MIPAIPTKYAGVQFRSRLEARWAAFFDLLGWNWDYEPIDLAGYIPDFVVKFRSPLLVEVKPFFWSLPGEQYCDAHQRIQESGWTDRAVVVGSEVPLVATSRMPALGRMTMIGNGLWVNGEWEPPRDAGRWLLLWRCWSCNEIVATSSAGPRCALCDFVAADGECRPAGTRQFRPEHAIEFWREAGNRVQWRSPR